MKCVELNLCLSVFTELYRDVLTVTKYKKNAFGYYAYIVIKLFRMVYNV